MAKLHSNILDFMPTPPHYKLKWDEMTEAYPWIQAMKGSTQDPIHHGEGDVWIHTKLVVEALISFNEWRELPDTAKKISFIAAVMHDIAKPQTKEIIDGRIRNPHHSRRGAAQTRRILWETGVASGIREMACSIIKQHQMPFWLFEEKPEWDIDHRIVKSSTTTSNRLLYLMAKADLIGRISPDQKHIMSNIELFKEAAEDLGCLDGIFKFHNDHSKMAYFANPESKKPSVQLYDPTDPHFTVTITSGLPGSGKSTWLEHETSTAGGEFYNQAVVSLDRIRDEMEIEQDDNQGRVRQEMLTRIRSLLREKSSFIIEGIFLNEDRRQPLIKLAMDYGARVQIVNFETPMNQLLIQNRQRPDYVPEDVIMKMLRKWEPAGPMEAHSILMVLEEHETPMKKFKTPSAARMN
jgi:predicted kinase